MITVLLGCWSAPPEARDHHSTVATEGPVRFVALGDAGKGNATQHAVAAALHRICAHRGCDFAVYLGDNLYPDGMTRPDDPEMKRVFSDVYGDALPFYAVLGNHDYGRSYNADNARYQIEWAAEHPAYNLPHNYYRFEAGNAAFWGLDTDAVFWAGPAPQDAWLDRTLAESTAEWKVVFGHHPYRSNGDHGNAGEYEGWSYLPYSSGASLRRFFEAHVTKADLYLAGHDHNLQSLSVDGLELVVSGAGASRRDLVDRGNTLRAGYDVPGFAWIELDERMTLAFYDENATLLSEHDIPHPSR